MTAQEAWSAARSRMVAELPFFGYLSFKLQHRPDPTIGTACTNGVEVRYNPKFVMDLTKECRVTLLAHEILHCAQSHMFRRGTRDPELSNLAADQEVDWILEELNIEVRRENEKNKTRKPEPFQWPPAELGHPAPDPKYRGWAYERIYDDMAKDWQSKPKPDQGHPQPGAGQSGQGQAGQPQPGQGQPQSGNGKPKPGEGSFGQVDDAPGGEAQKELLEGQWKDAVAQAAKLCRARGSLPQSLRRMVAQLIDPPISLEEQLRQFYLDRVREDYSWQTPNRRYAGAGFYLPSLDSRSMGEVVLACDSSGSITDEDWAKFISLVNHVVSDVMPAKTTVIVCDAQIQQVTEFERGEEVVPGTVQNLGGGGTAFEPVFEHVEKENINPVCLIYFTDLEGSYPEIEPGYPVLWVTKTEGRAVPFGEIVRYP